MKAMVRGEAVDHVCARNCTAQPRDDVHAPAPLSKPVNITVAL